MSNPYRLKSSMFSRGDDNLQVEPERVVFLSVEGKTESDYLHAVHRHRRELGIRGVVQIEVLQKSDTNSDADSISALLEEYMEIREQGMISEEMKEAFPEKFTKEFIEAYVSRSESLTEDDKEEFEEFLQQASIDIAYRKYLSEIKSDDDYFGVVLDRDCGDRTPGQMKKLLELCTREGYQCFITNPCFDFWLLLHLEEGIDFIQKNQEAVLENRHVSKKHTFTGQKLSILAHHNKTITDAQFRQVYLSNIDSAIERAKQFESDPQRLMEQLGTNMPRLFDILRKE